VEQLFALVDHRFVLPGPAFDVGPGKLVCQGQRRNAQGYAAGGDEDDNFVQTVEGTSLETIRRFTNPQPKRQVALAWRTSFPRPKAIDVLQQAIAASQLTCIRTRIRRSRRN